MKYGHFTNNTATFMRNTANLEEYGQNFGGYGQISGWEILIIQGDCTKVHNVTIIEPCSPLPPIKTDKNQQGESGRGPGEGKINTKKESVKPRGG